MALSTLRQSWLVRVLIGLVSYLKGKTSRWTVLVLAVGFLLVALAFNDRATSLDAAQRKSDKQLVDFALYIGSYQLYSQATSARDLCLDGVTRSDANRGQHALIIGQLREAGLDAVADVLESGPLFAIAARVAAECGPTPIPPKVPEGIEPFLATLATLPPGVIPS